jgi:acetoacetyl-CoA synthetase
VESQILFSPNKEQVQNSQMSLFQKFIEESYGKTFSSWAEFHQWSVEKNEDFWCELLDYFSVTYEGETTPVNTSNHFESYGWFPKIKLNFAQNLLKEKSDTQVAMRFLKESGTVETISYHSLNQSVAKLQKALKNLMGPGDVLAAYMPNIPETVISMLATSSLGGVFTSTSSDFGVAGVMDRFNQSKPKILVAAVSYQYNGKIIDMLPKLQELEKNLPSVEKIILVDFLSSEKNDHGLDKGVWWDDFQIGCESVSETPEFTQMNFSDPLYIMYSSGTTGKPKCIVHSIGGTLLQHIKEHGLHCDLKKGTSIFYFTTCGWMMWNWLVSGLYFGAEIVLYDGSPGVPSPREFFNFVNYQNIHIFGTSPKFLKVLEEDQTDVECVPSTNLKMILSTGAPLLPEQFDFVYKDISPSIYLSSICGGTDILGCFMLGNPVLPVKRGEIQSFGLGMDVASFDLEGKEVVGTEAELVCKKSFPSRPLCFLDDPENKLINKAYFSQFENVWHHGDFITVTKDKGVMVFGRSDATLNPGGVRIGTAEIYRQTEQLDFLADSLCVGLTVDGEVEVALFVLFKDSSISLTDDHKKQIKLKIRQNTTPRHVPAHIFQVTDIPYTRSGKKMELLVTHLVNGKNVANLEAVKNPECLLQYKSLNI